MHPIQNPYAPGAGAPPPELAGRDALLKNASIALQRLVAGRFGRSFILTGLRGVGKTVLLNRIRQDAEANKMITVRFEVAEGRSLPSLLAPGLKTAILKLNRGKAAADRVTRGLKALATFVSTIKVKYHDIDIGLDTEPDQHFSSVFDLDESLTQLFQAVGAAAKEKKTAIVLFIDELQMLNEHELASLIVALHMAAQDQLPITMVAAGLPQLPAKMGEAKTYAERLFEFHQIGELNDQAATQALAIPAEKLNVHFTEGALKEILTQTQGYAYFLQEWGKHAWDVARKSPITKKDAEEATLLALSDLDASFFRVRFDQLSPSQKDYLSAMSELGAGPFTSGQVAEVLNKPVTAFGPVRHQLINKGLIYSPSHGLTAFTVPLFDAFMKRVVSL